MRIDTRKWLLGKLYPHVYGDKVTQEITGAGGGKLEVVLVPAVPRAIHDAECELFKALPPGDVDRND